MQTRVQAPSEASNQQIQNPQRSAQLLAERQATFEDNSPQTAQLDSLQAMMSNSLQHQRRQALQASISGSAHTQQMRTVQSRMVASQARHSAPIAAFNSATVPITVTQRMDEDEPLQAKFEGDTAPMRTMHPLQRAEYVEPLQGKFDPVQPVEDEQLLQGKFEQGTDSLAATVAAAQLEETSNITGLPDQLKSGIESLSGMRMDHVKVHFNSDKPAQLQAHAYAQGSEIHVAPGQEQHLPHEAWHVVQQAQGRVKPTLQMKIQPDHDVQPIQRVINITSDDGQYDNASELQVVIEKIGKETTEKISEVKKKIVAIKKLIESGVNKFDNYAQLWHQVNPKLDPLESVYVRTSPTLIKQQYEGEKPGTISFFRAMSNTEAEPLAKSGEFGMRINSSGYESSIKFFATDIGYSIRLSNRKNDEAYLKNEDLPYIRMFSAAVWAPDVYEGLVNDIGIHRDATHTAKKLDQEWDDSADKPIEQTQGQEWLSTVVKAQGGQSDKSEHGYVIKHESDGFNFGVKARSTENMRGATQSPIQYFNNLVSAIYEVGKFELRAKE